MTAKKQPKGNFLQHYLTLNIYSTAIRVKDKERIKIMADFEDLSFSYLGLLSNAHHDGTTQQIDDCCGNFETENQVFLRKAQTLHQCRVKEDEAWNSATGTGDWHQETLF